MPINRACTPILLSLAGALIFSAAGCEDSASKQRDQMQAQLTKIRRDLQQAVATGGETAEAYQANLNTIVTQLTSLNSGEPGQQAAKALLAADALREVASVHVDAASKIEAQHRADLGAVNARIDAVLRISSLADGLGTIDGARRSSELQAELQKARDGVAAAQARVAELDSPINERNAQNTQQKTEIERLRLQVGELLRQAQGEGYSAGFATYKQATEVNRQADKIEFEVSNREIDLEHDLNPQHKMAQTQQAQLEAMAQAIETAQAELSAFAKAAAGDAQSSRAKAAELSKTINDNLAQIKSQSDGELKAAYEAALSALDQAAANARTASTGGPDANAARMIGAAVNVSIARLHMAMANGLADRIDTLKRIKASNGAVAMTGVDGQIAELTTARQTAVDAAKAALDAAAQSADSAAGGSPEIDGFRAQLMTLSAALSGNPAPSDTPPADDTGAPPADAPADAPVDAPTDAPAAPAGEPAPAPASDAPAAPDSGSPPAGDPTPG